MIILVCSKKDLYKQTKNSFHNGSKKCNTCYIESVLWSCEYNNKKIIAHDIRQRESGEYMVMEKGAMSALEDRKNFCQRNCKLVKQRYLCVCVCACVHACGRCVCACVRAVCGGKTDKPEFRESDNH